MSMLDCDLCNLNVSNRTDRSVSGGGGEGGGTTATCVLCYLRLVVYLHHFCLARCTIIKLLRKKNICGFWNHSEIFLHVILWTPDGNISFCKISVFSVSSDTLVHIWAPL